MDHKQNPSALLDETNIDYKDIQKMVFIFNALNDGWAVKKLNNEKFEFTKDNENIKQEIVLEEYIKKYINYKIGNK